MEGRVISRSPGSWTIIYDLPPDSSGKRKQKYETFQKITKKQANQKLRARVTALENGSYIPVVNETVAGFLEMWLKTYAATNTTLRTQMGYREKLENYVMGQGSIGNVQLQKLIPQQIQGMYAGMLERGLSAQTVLHTHRVLREALKHAVLWGKLVRNVADAVTPPRPQQQELEIWDLETICRFLEQVRGTRYADLYRLAVLTGMRRSEICGLQWKNVDLTRGRLAVVSTLQRITGEGLVEGQPKTPRSRRTISLGPEAVNLLHETRGRQMEQQLEAGELWQNTGYVFTQADGTPVDPDSVSKDFPAQVQKLGLPHLTFHGLRHLHASLNLYAGAELDQVSKSMGHSTIAVTADIYGHLLPGRQEAAARALEALLAQGRPATE